MVARAGRKHMSGDHDRAGLYSIAHIYVAYYRYIYITGIPTFMGHSMLHLHVLKLLRFVSHSEAKPWLLKPNHSGTEP